MKKMLTWIVTILLLTGCAKTAQPEPPYIEPLTSEETSALELEAPQPNSVTISMVGDVLLHETVSNSGRMADGSYQYDHLFQNVRDEIAAADLAIVNQEVILGGRELGLSGYPNFNGAFEVGDALVRAGFDVVLHATNHALDKKEAGVRNCLHFWKTSYPDIAVLGIYDSTAARDTVYVREINGIRIAILNYTYGTNGMLLPGGSPYTINLLEESKVRADIAQAQNTADFVIVAPHWGTEYTLKPDASQEKWTQIFYECGVNLVIGTHPHVIEPVEMITGDKGNMLVYYSLGNFINSTAETGKGIANRMVGAMAQITITMDDQGKAYISNYGVLPLVTHVRTGSGQITTYKLSDYTQTLAEENEICSSDPDFSLVYCQNLCRQVFGELYN
ncbi:MAG: CapA family protein [Clostridiales bacterium]|jgi:poly-gamma-glutamate capsule biosynthesis protein CapA/YwtB (metallophosphatase superfamily)|nr:CapA family protein [Clostridiales bacterium]